MTIRREADAIVRDPFDPAAPGDYAASPEAMREVLETLAGKNDDLYDPRYPGPLQNYIELHRRDESGGAIVILGHRTLEHCLELTIQVVPIGSYLAASHFVIDLLATLSRPTVKADPEDRGALEKYRLLERREEGSFTVLRLRHILTKDDMEVAFRVEPVPAERAYALALEQDEIWRKSGHVVFDERNVRPR